MLNVVATAFLSRYRRQYIGRQGYYRNFSLVQVENENAGDDYD